MASSTSQRIDENDMNDSPSDEFLALQNRNLNLDKNSIINLMCHNKLFLFGFISAEFFFSFVYIVQFNSYDLYKHFLLYNICCEQW